jgi:hypothetical protein
MPRRRGGFTVGGLQTGVRLLAAKVIVDQLLGWSESVGTLCAAPKKPKGAARDVWINRVRRSRLAELGQYLPFPFLTCACAHQPCLYLRNLAIRQKALDIS